MTIATKGVKEVSKVELSEAIRKQRRDEGVSIRELARRHGVHRRTVRQALACVTPIPRKIPERASPALGPYEETIRQWLVEDLSAPRKQRHTARRVLLRLRDECGARLAESTVRAKVAQIKAELGDRLRDVTIPQAHGPGAQAEATSLSCCYGRDWVSRAGGGMAALMGRSGAGGKMRRR